MGGRYDLTDFEWSIIEPLLPNKPHGVPRVDDRRVLDGIFWVLRSGAPWRDLPERYGPYTTCYNRFNRWRKAGVWGRIMDAVSKAYDGDIQMIDSSVIRVHQHAANVKKRPSSFYGPLTRRTNYQSSCPDRHVWPAHQAGADAGPGPRYQWCRHAAKRLAGWRYSSWRQGLRRGLDQGRYRSPRRGTKHSRQVQPQASSLFLKDAVQRAQSQRTLFQQGQTLSSGCNAV